MFESRVGVRSRLLLCLEVARFSIARAIQAENKAVACGHALGPSLDAVRRGCHLKAAVETTSFHSAPLGPMTSPRHHV